MIYNFCVDNDARYRILSHGPEISTQYQIKTKTILYRFFGVGKVTKLY